MATKRQKGIYMEGNTTIEVKVTTELPECCRNCDCDRYMEEIYLEAVDNITGEAARQAIESFMFLTRNVMSAKAAKHIIKVLEYLEAVDDGKPALEMLYSMFCAAGMAPVAETVSRIISLGATNPDVYSLFMEIFFDDEEIDYYLVSNWLAETVTEVEDGDM
ncbi:MAG: hypothetical protein ACOX4R_03630 [Lentihominibacter sp.]